MEEVDHQEKQRIGDFMDGHERYVQEALLVYPNLSTFFL